MRRAAALLLVAVFTAGASTSASAAQQITALPGFNGAVYAVSQPDANGDFFVGGAFSAYRPWQTGSAAVLGAATGEVDTSFPRVGKTATSSGQVLAMQPDGAGGLFIGGDFACVGGDAMGDGDCTDAGEYARGGLAHIHADGSVDPTWAPAVQTGRAVQSLGVLGGVVYAGGNFTTVTVGGVTTNRRLLAAFDASTGALTAWDPKASLTSGSPEGIFTMATANGLVYVGGNVTCFNSNADSDCTDTGEVPRNRVAALDPITGVPTAWNPNASSTVYAVLPQGSTVYLAGNFTTLGTDQRRYIGAVSAADGRATGWNPGANSLIYALAAGGNGLIYAGGTFSSIGTTTASRNRLAALDATGVATGWNPASTGDVVSMAVSGDTVYVAGAFSVVGGAPRRRLAAIDAGTGLATAWNPNPDKTSRVVVVSGDALYVGGDFTSVGGDVRTCVAQIRSTGEITRWAPVVQPSSGDCTAVRAFAQRGGTVYIGGNFEKVNGSPRMNAAAFDASGALTAWAPNPNGGVRDLAVSGSSVFVAGAFGAIGAQSPQLSQPGLAKVDAITGDGMSAFNATLDGGSRDVYSIALSGSTLYAGGLFTSLGGETRSRLGAVDTTTGSADAQWNPGVSTNQVAAVEVSGSTVYAGGYFDNVGGASPAHAFIAAMPAADGSSSGTPLAWAPTANIGVKALAAASGTLYVGGEFSQMGDPRTRLAAFADPVTGTTPLAWNPGASGGNSAAVNALSIGSPGVVVGGLFTTVGTQGSARSNLAMVDPVTGDVVPWWAPGAPTAVAGVAGNASATVSWTPPLPDSSAAITSYTATASPGGATCTSAASDTSCMVTGLVNGTAYTFTVTAINSVGTSVPSRPSSPVTPTGPSVPAAAIASAPKSSPSSRTRRAAGYMVVSPRAMRMGVPVAATGSVPITLACPKSGPACRMTGVLTTHRRALGRAHAISDPRVVLGHVAATTVAPGRRRAVSVRISPSRMRSLQAAGIRRVPALLTLRTASSPRPVVRVQRLRLLLPAVRTAVTG